VELPPALLPPRFDVDGLHGPEDAPEPPLAGAVGVRGELDDSVRLAFLEAVWRELEQARAGLLRALRIDADRDPPETQRKALLSFSKKPSSRR
jgi:hypothetical protein